MAAVTICNDFGAPQNKVSHCFYCFSIYCHELMGPDAMVLVFWMLSFKPTFSLSSFTFIKRLFSSSLLSDIEWCYLHIWGYWYFSWQSWFQPVLLPAQHSLWCTLHIRWISTDDVIQLPSCVWLCVTPWTIGCQVPLSMGFPRQEYGSGSPFPSPGHLLNWGTEPGSPALAGGFFITEPPGNEEAAILW